MMNYGTQIVAGVPPGKGGSWVLNEKVPVFDSMQMAVEATDANTSIIYGEFYYVEALLKLKGATFNPWMK
jgi:succinyl-CoA synthetase alpha subunit